MNAQTEKLPKLQFDDAQIRSCFHEPEKLVELIREQASGLVFSMETAKGRDECSRHYNLVIKCIAPIKKVSTSLAADAKKIIEADIAFRKATESGIREIANEIRRPLTLWETEQERIAKEKAEEGRIAREAIEADAREKQRLIDEELELLRSEKAAREAKEQAEIAEQERKERVEKEQVERQVREEKIRQEAIELDNARLENERKQREASEAHVKMVDEAVYAALIDVGIDTGICASSVLQAIKDGKIPHVTISY